MTLKSIRNAFTWAMTIVIKPKGKNQIKNNYYIDIKKGYKNVGLNTNVFIHPAHQYTNTHTGICMLYVCVCVCVCVCINQRIYLYNVNYWYLIFKYRF